MTEIKLLPDIITNGTLSDSCIIPIVDPVNNILYSVSVGDLKAYIGTPSAPPPPSTINRVYAADGDENGIFFFAGQNWITSNAWQNPITLGTITTSNSGYLNNYADISAPFDRQNSNFSTSYNQNSFVSASLVTKKARITKYSIKTWNLADVRHLRNWNLQGSNDGQSWTDIDTRVNDTSLTGTSAWKTFTPSGNTSDFFRDFRILLTGVDSTNDYYISLGEWELYGELSNV